MTLETRIRECGLSGDGANWRVVWVDARAYPSWVFSEKTREIAFALPPLSANERAAAVAALVREWAVRAIPLGVAATAKTTGFEDRYKRVSVRDQSTRWGSCSSSGTLSLNWRLVLLPWALHAYVLLHEFGHFAHMNHSGEFWDFLHRFDPDAGKKDRALSQCAAQIMRLEGV